MKITEIVPANKKGGHILAYVAVKRGCKTPAEIRSFVDENPAIVNYSRLIPDYAKALNRIRLAINNKEKIAIYGDYDCDGITSLAQMVLFFRMARANVSWFIPNRISDDYGLTTIGVTKCLEECKPNLIIAVDCGSTSKPQIAFLKEKQVDTIIIDHHGIPDPSLMLTGLGAVAHLNPKAWIGQANSTEIDELATMSAAGLVYLLTESLAKDLNVYGWDKNAGILLGGLGTLVDVMPLKGVNRSLVKQSLKLANSPHEILRVPGLEALRQVVGVKVVTSWTYGFDFGPRINATGRLDDARNSVELLLAPSVDAARLFALECDRVNRDRREMQMCMVDEALKQAETIMQLDPKTKVLVLTHPDWHTGVVGIVASKIKEKFCRPTFVCGWVEEDDAWKGSGRSMDGYDLGKAVAGAVAKGLLIKGGGHAMAAGIKFQTNQLDNLRSYLNESCLLTDIDFQHKYETVGDPKDREASEWVSVYDQLEPFGAGNAKPCLLVRSARISAPLSDRVKTNKETKESKIYAVRGTFMRPGSMDIETYDWHDITRAKKEWEFNGLYDLVVTVRKRVMEGDKGPVTYYNWSVEDCCRVG